MPLTPEDVRNKRFTAVRLREGYDMGEVDQFLDEIEVEFERLISENEELRAKLAASAHAEPTAAIAAASASEEVDKVDEVKEEVVEVQAQPEPQPIVAPTPTAAPSIGEASAAAARLLEIASNNADELVESAKAEAEAIVNEAKQKAERITREARGNADRAETEARIRAQKLDEETATRRKQAFDAIDRERSEIQRDVEQLKAYEREYRARLKNYFQSQLDMLESQTTVATELPSEAAQTPQAPRRVLTTEGESDVQ